MAREDSEPKAGAIVGDTSNALGARLRELRVQSGLSVSALARRLDISVSAVSQIETGAMTPSVNRLLAIVTTLGVSLAAAFERPATSGNPALVTPPLPRGEYRLARSGTVDPIHLDGGIVYRRLSPGPIDGLELFESTYPPNSAGSRHGDLGGHEGFEVGSVSSGTLRIQFDDETVELGAGDSITFASTRPHRLSNRSDVPCVAVWMIVHSVTSA